MDLSFIIPAFNEGARIEASLIKTREYFAAQSYECEVLVVDDGSRDETSEIVKRHAGEGIRLIQQPRNMGKGAAVRRGMLEGKGTYRIFSDADFSTPITETVRMMAALKEHDVVIGSRGIDSSYIKKHQPWYRESMGKVFNLFVQATAIPRIKDTQRGFKGVRGPAAEATFSRAKIDGFSFDVEALFLARRLGYSIKEMPVEWHDDARSTLNPISDSVKMLRELLKIRALHRNTDMGREAGQVRSAGRLPTL